MLSWSRDRNIGCLFIYYSCWSTLNSILKISLYMRYLVLKYQYHSQMQLKILLCLANIIKIMHIEQTYLRALSHELRKLEWIWYIFQDSIFGVIYFQSINSLLLFGDIDLELKKDQTLIIKVFKLMIHTRSPRILQNYSPS